MSLSSLLEETRLLNSKAIATWKKAITLPEPEMDIEMNKIWVRLEMMNAKCQDLMDSGYTKCLYEIKRCDKEPSCFVCPLTGRENETT
jgi:hypothetical protein